VHQYRERMHSHISLLTDYGLNDEFVGVMKSVLTDMAPHVRITDLTHGVPAFDVRAGSLALARAVQYVPAGIVIAVVDPGVGSSRRAIAVEVAGGRGIFLDTLLHQAQRLRVATYLRPLRRSLQMVVHLKTLETKLIRQV